jgi:hypothetical protein
MESRDEKQTASLSEPSSGLAERIIIEDALAEAMLSEIYKDAGIKQELATIAILVNEKIFEPIRQSAQKVNFDFTLLPDDKNISDKNKFKSALKYLINEHTNAGRQKTGIFKDSTPSQIESDPALLEKLLSTLSNNLLSGNKIDSYLEVEKCIKALTDACYCYNEYFLHTNVENYEEIKNLIMPSQQESSARIKYSEDGQSEKLTMSSSTGISKDQKSIVDKKNALPDAYISGKSTFTKVDSVRMLELEISKFDQLQSIRKELLARLEVDNFDENSEERLELVQEKYRDQVKVLRKFSVPLEARHRNLVATYIKPSFIENLAGSSMLPLIATSSGTEGRALISLYCLDAFGRDEKFDPNKALLITNCIFSALQYGGHHSYVELVEPYNRLLDAVGIVCVNKNKKVIFDTYQIPVVEAGNKEQISRFIHERIRDTVIASMERLIQPAVGLENQGTSIETNVEPMQRPATSDTTAISGALSVKSGVNTNQAIRASRADQAISSPASVTHSKKPNKKSEEEITRDVKADAIDSSNIDAKKDKSELDATQVPEPDQLPTSPSRTSR